MEKMSTTKERFQKEEKPYVRISESKTRAQTVRMRESQTTLLSDIPTARLIDLWVARWGHDWVDLVEVTEDPFYKDAYDRMRREGELEVHFLTDRSKYVCRNPK
jgi:hypothetical protein